MDFDPSTAQAVHADFDPGTAKPVADERAGKFIPQMTKSLYDHVPFGKRAVSMLPNGEQIGKNIEGTPEAKGLAGNAGHMAGEMMAFAPAFEFGGAMAGAAKLAGGAVGVGAQVGAESKMQGEDNKTAAIKGIGTAAGTYAGGRILEGAGKMLTAIPQGFRDTSGRIHDYIAKLPTKAFSYGKDPLKVMADEKITANNIHEYSSQADERLTQRTQELNDAVKNSDAKVNLEDAVDTHIKDAQAQAEGSLQDRTELSNKLAEMRGRISVKYGNLDNISLSDAVKLKRQIADDFPFSPLESKGSTSNLLAKAGHKIHHAINEAIDSAAPHVGELNEKVSSLIDISKAAQNRVAIESRNNPLGLIATIVGVGAAGAAAGGATGHNPLESGLGAALMTKALTSPAVLTRVANVLSHMADVDKINLFKTSPEFMNLAQKAHEYMASGEGKLGMAGQAGSKATPVEAELVSPAKKPEPITLKGLPEPLSKTARVGVNPPEPITRSDRLLEKSNKSYSGPVIRMQGHNKSFRRYAKENPELADKWRNFGKGEGVMAAGGVAASGKQKYKDEDAIKTIIGEGENTGEAGMRALAGAIRNRGTLHGAYGLSSPRVVKKLYSQKIYQQAKQAWEESKAKDYSKGANHWFSEEDLKQPRVQKMIKDMKYLGRYGGNKFYQEKKGGK